MSDDRIAPASDYDEFVDWDKRLAREAGLYERAFQAVGAQRVIDVGAGSARHAIMFAKWGLDVVAVDPDESMLAQARANAAAAESGIRAAGGTLAIVEAGFGELAAAAIEPADALVCSGNALPHVEGRAGLARALADFAASLKPGGVAILHLLNHGRLLEKRPRAIPPVVRDTAHGLKVFLRVIDYPQGDEFLDFDFLTLVRNAEGDWDLTHRRSPHTALPTEVLVPALETAGFGRVELLGGHDGHALTDADESVIVLAYRQ